MSECCTKISGIYTNDNFVEMDITPDTIEAHIPYYLTHKQKEGLVKALADFRETSVDYYINKYPDEVLQGDGWPKLEVIRFEDGERSQIKGIVLSNTCDIAQGNVRAIPSKLVFAPIIKLSNYAMRLTAAKMNSDQIDSKLQAIKEQRVTTMFYLPAGAGLDDEYIALLDDLHTIPAHAFTASQDRPKLFTLSMIGFYLFLFKLSVHFCRFHEEVVRDEVD